MSNSSSYTPDSAPDCESARRAGVMTYIATYKTVERAPDGTPLCLSESQYEFTAASLREAVATAYGQLVDGDNAPGDGLMMLDRWTGGRWLSVHPDVIARVRP